MNFSHELDTFHPQSPHYHDPDFVDEDKPRSYRQLRKLFKKSDKGKSKEEINLF